MSLFAYRSVLFESDVYFTLPFWVVLRRAKEIQEHMDKLQKCYKQLEGFQAACASARECRHGNR